MVRNGKKKVSVWQLAKGSVLIQLMHDAAEEEAFAEEQRRMQAEEEAFAEEQLRMQEAAEKKEEEQRRKRKLAAPTEAARKKFVTRYYGLRALQLLEQAEGGE